MDIEWLKLRWRGFKEKRFLESYGCKTWREYERKYDNDFCAWGRKIKQIYHGYPHVIVYPSDEFIPVWKENLCEEMIKWCEINCTQKWRNDWQRVLFDQWSNDWIENGIGGADKMFFAFKSEQDAVMFLLVWQ